jgi:hypothetical protein
MPEMSGGDVARRVLATRPDVKVLLISGYVEDALGRKGHATEGFAPLPTPFVPGNSPVRCGRCSTARARPG